MPKYKVELTGHTRYFTVTGEEGSEFLVVEFRDEEGSSDWEVMDERDHCVPENLRNELIDAVKAYLEKES